MALFVFHHRNGIPLSKSMVSLPGQNNDVSNPSLGLYLHVPFCASTCDFCAFYQEKPLRRSIERYLEGVERELASLDLGRSVEFVFWGGGTPGLLPAKDLYRLGRAMLEAVGRPREWSIEMAPSSVKPDKLKVLKELGVTRISMGVQSFNPELLKALGRQHNLQQIHRAYQWMQEEGFTNINLDLMFAIPGQSLEAWRADLQQAIELEPQHISTYCLTFEEDTALFFKLSQGRLSVDPEWDAALYKTTWEVLEQAGFAQYEISNFARPGYECLHNLNTWHMGEWIGLGPSAASQFRGRRFANPASLEDWLKGLEEGRPRRVDEVNLSETTLATDALIFGLRMNAGVDLMQLKERFPGLKKIPLEPFFEQFQSEGFVIFKEDRCLCLTQRGRLLADALALEIMEFCERESTAIDLIRTPDRLGIRGDDGLIPILT